MFPQKCPDGRRSRLRLRENGRVSAGGEQLHGGAREPGGHGGVLLRQIPPAHGVLPAPQQQDRRPHLLQRTAEQRPAGGGAPQQSVRVSVHHGLPVRALAPLVKPPGPPGPAWPWPAPPSAPGQSPGGASGRQSCPPPRPPPRQAPAGRHSWRPRRRRWSPAGRAFHSPPPGSGPVPAGPDPARGLWERIPSGRSGHSPKSPAARTGNGARREAAAARTAGRRRYCRGERAAPAPLPPPDKKGTFRSRTPWAFPFPLPALFGSSYHVPRRGASGEIPFRHLQRRKRMVK